MRVQTIWFQAGFNQLCQNENMQQTPSAGRHFRLRFRPPMKMATIHVNRRIGRGSFVLMHSHIHIVHQDKPFIYWKPLNGYLGKL